MNRRPGSHISEGTVKIIDEKGVFLREKDKRVEHISTIKRCNRCLP